jgi:hypothetical protein
MRKLLAAAVITVTALSLAGVALAANVYTVGGSSPTPGRATHIPRAVALNFDFQVKDQNPDLRGTPIETFAIGSEGIVTYPQLFPTCTLSQANSDEHKSKCRKALVGRGLVQVLVGPPTNQASTLYCNLRLTLYNLSGQGKHGGMAIRLDADTISPPLMDPDDRTINCPTPLHVAIRSKFVSTHIGGVRADELRFSVPPDLLHPTGLDATVRNNESKILRRVSRKKVKVAGKPRRVGFYSAIACKGPKRTIQATFTAEDGVKARARTQIKRC